MQTSHLSTKVAPHRSKNPDDGRAGPHVLQVAAASSSCLTSAWSIWIRPPTLPVKTFNESLRHRPVVDEWIGVPRGVRKDEPDMAEEMREERRKGGAGPRSRHRCRRGGLIVTRLREGVEDS